MDALGPLLEHLSGPAMGAALVGLVIALRRRMDAGSETESAAAKAVTELVVQMGELRKDLSRETAARVQLQTQVDTLEVQLADAHSHRMHLEGQVHVLTLEANGERRARQAAEKWAHQLAAEMRALRDAITSGHTNITLPPPPKLPTL